MFIFTSIYDRESEKENIQDISNPLESSSYY